MKLRLLLASVVLAVTVCGGTLYATDVAILNSSINTRTFFERHYLDCAAPGFYLGADEYQRYFMGWTYVLSHPESGSPIPYDIIYDAGVAEATLSGYKLLILSNTASLSDDQQKTIRQWVIRGGRLIATFGSGYKDTTRDPRQTDQLKLSEGGTVGLHQLWHDPMSKIFGSNPVNHGQGTDVRITQYVGPTACLLGELTGDLLLYGAESNLLVHRPENFGGALGFVVLKGVSTTPHPTPAIVWTQMAKGLVVYYAFAPEYLVSKEFSKELPLRSCDDGQNWAGRSAQGRILMECTVKYLLAK